MAHATRGHRSNTYDIEEVLDVNETDMTITFRDAAHVQPQKVRLRPGEWTAVGVQMFRAMAASLRVHGDGDWESSAWLNGFSAAIARLVDELVASGVRDLSDADVTLTQLRDALGVFAPEQARSLNKLLARAVKANHPNGQQLARALRNTTYIVKDSSTTPYDEDEAAAIEAVAKRRLSDAFIAQRAVLQDLGYDVNGRAWLRIPAEEVVARARHLLPPTGAVPGIDAPRAQLAAYALLNPRLFGPVRGRPRATFHSALLDVAHALYPPVEVLTAALIVHCLAETVGLNVATMLGTRPDDLLYTGTTTGILQVAKARNHTEDDLAVRTDSMFTLGGLVATLTGLTRFSRHFRATELAGMTPLPDVVNRLYVEHVADPARSQTLPLARVQQAWRSKVFDEHWPPALDRDHVGLRFRALRSQALLRAVKTDPDGDVHGHTPRVRVHYLAHVLPDHVLHKHAAAAQDAILSDAQHSFAERAEAAARLAEVPEDSRLDVIVGTCVSAGNDPDKPDTPCSLGLAACFTCPNGYRTVEHVPGLLATVAFTQLIADNDPQEWANGDASALHYYATECLKQFPQAVVDAASKTDLRPHLAVLPGLYTEMRR